MVNITRFGSYGELSEAVLRLFIDLEREHSNKNGRFSVAFPGGRSPVGLLNLLTSEDLAWRDIDIFFTDERCVPPDDSRSNYRLINDLLISKIDIPDGNVYRIKGEFLPEEGADDYDKAIRKYTGDSGLDLIILGIGEDCHIASIFPGFSLQTEDERLAYPVPEAPVSPRVTISPLLIRRSTNLLLLISGREKDAALDLLMNNETAADECPAKMLLSHTGLKVFQCS